jgi:hypothetical protein
MRYGKLENGVLLFKARKGLLYNSRDIMPILMFVRAMIGKSAWRSSTSPRHRLQPLRRPRRPLRATDDILIRCTNDSKPQRKNENALT